MTLRVRSQTLEALKPLPALTSSSGPLLF